MIICREVGYQNAGAKKTSVWNSRKYDVRLIWVRKDFNNMCIPITFSNTLKACFLNKKYLLTIQTFPTQIVKVYFLLKNHILSDF